MTLFELCNNYIDNAQYQSSIKDINEHIYNLCSKYLLEDNPSPYTISQLKAFFNLN